MMLYEAMMDDCVLMEKVRTADGLGGWSTIWTEGASFKAAIKKDDSMQGRIAEKEGVTALYTVSVQKGMPIEFHDAFIRVSDQKVFRVTSTPKDNESPKFSAINFGQFTAEEWTLE